MDGQVAGWLQRKMPGLIFSSWKKEWYILDCKSGTLSRSSSPSAKAEPEVIPLSAIVKVTKKAKTSFEVQLKSGSPMYFNCYSEQELADWIKTFTTGIQMLSPMHREPSSDDMDESADRALSSSGTKNSTSEGKKKGVEEQQIPSSQTTGTSPTVPNKRKSSAKPSARASRAQMSTPDIPSDIPQEASSPSRNALMGEIKGRADGAQSTDSGQSISIAAPTATPSKKESILFDNTVFMGKARNFAVSTGKQFVASAKAKGVGFDGPSSVSTRNLTSDTIDSLENTSEPSKSRQAVIPMHLQEENVDPSRFVKDDAQKKKLCEIIESALDDFLGGNLISELGSSAIVDLMYAVTVKQGDTVIQQGEPTSCMYVVETGKMGIYTQDFVNKPPEFVEEKKPGDFFGALTLLYNQPGPFTVKALRESILWALPRTKFHDISAQASKKRAGRKIRLLESVPLIADNLERTSILELADVMDSVMFNAGEFIISAGDELKQLYFIAEGSVAILVGGSNIPIGDLSKGEAFGEWALLDIGAKSEVTLVAKSECTIMTLKLSEVEELVGPLRDYVTKRWAEERGDQFFFNENEARVGTTLFESRNPLSNAPQTLAFTSPKTETTSNNAESTPAAVEGRLSTSKLTSEQVNQVVAEAIEQAKNRATVSASRKTKAATAAATTTPPTIAVSATSTSLEATATKSGEVSSIQEEKEAPASNKPKGADDDDDDVEGDEEDNLDMPFTKCQPLRPELTLDAITPCALLGRGNFGRVHLCRNEKDHTEIFALKVLARHFIVSNGWEILVENERNAMLELSTMTKSPFLLKLFHSYSDKKNIYLLLELCQGGDLYNLLRITKGNRFGEDVAMYYMACVTLGLEAMHSRTIIYRDLKPENLMLDKTGLVKIADFGLAKKTLRTYTVCGTPDYMAPEVIVSRGHAAAVDWWAIGVLLYEMVGAATPFYGKEAMDVYDAIINHTDEDDLKWPDAPFSPNAKSLITRLLHPKKTKRLGIVHPGVDGVKKHPFFTGFDWAKLEKLELAPPLKPNFVDMTKYTTGNAPKNYNSKIKDNPDDNSGWKLDF